MSVYLIKKGNEADLRNILCNENKCEWHFWEDAGYYPYRDKYNMHFSPELADNASHEIYGNDFWTKDQIKAVMRNMGLLIPANYKICDIQYALNAERKVHRGGEVLNTDEKIFKYVWEDIQGIDSYSEKIFVDYLSEKMIHADPIIWDQVM